MKYLKLLIAVTNLVAIATLLKENSSLRARLDEMTDKYWEGNMQIALYSDEVNKLRKKAKWEPMKDQKGNEHYYICSRCGDWSILKKNFCGECGSDMREGEQ